MDYIRKYFLTSVKSAVFCDEKPHITLLFLAENASFPYRACIIRVRMLDIKFRSAKPKINKLCFFSLGIFISSTQKFVPRISLDMLMIIEIT